VEALCAPAGITRAAVIRTLRFLAFAALVAELGLAVMHTVGAVVHDADLFVVALATPGMVITRVELRLQFFDALSQSIHSRPIGRVHYGTVKQRHKRFLCHLLLLLDYDYFQQLDRIARLYLVAIPFARILVSNEFLRVFQVFGIKHFRAAGRVNVPDSSKFGHIFTVS